VTAFGGGEYLQRNGRWYLSSWIRKSFDNGLYLNPFCQYGGYLCVRYNGSTLRPGDSGGALVGWVGGWKLLGVLTWAQQLTDDNLQFGAAVSMADPGARSFVDQQAAAPFN
jgi:hypothetical protein